MKVLKYNYGEYTVIGPHEQVCEILESATIHLYIYYAYSDTRSYTSIGVDTDEVFYNILAALDNELESEG